MRDARSGNQDIDGSDDGITWVKPDRDKNIQKTKASPFSIERVLILFSKISHDFIDFLSKIAYYKNNLNK